nr:uncharacterized protein LOC129426651 [Misgurnus anguillicaudatus]
MAGKHWIKYCFNMALFPDCSLLGWGVFSCRHFQKGDFLFEYRGQVLTKEEYERRHSELEVFLFEFRFDGRQLWVDASKDDGSLGRLVNDDHVNPNSKMKIITVNRKPHLCLFAVKNISPGDEIMYNYGDSDWPWRNKVTSETEQQSHRSINCAGDDDGTQKGRRTRTHTFTVILENSAERGDARRIQKRVWSPTEISAVMRHFRNHIAKGKLATKIECLQCKNAEHPALDSRSVQNIRDFASF